MNIHHLPGPIHFVGIGGIGMSGIAEVLYNAGFEVRGSDEMDGSNVQRLRALGIQVALKHDVNNLSNAKTVVFSSAIKSSNPELIAARQRSITVLHRGDILAEIIRQKRSVVVAGTHGKTTTTSMIGALLDASTLSPTIINGGIINAYNSPVKLGAGEWVVVESDESDGSFVKLPAEVVVVTNIGREHLNYYRSFEKLKNAFQHFIEQIPLHGFAVLCIDHPVVCRLSEQIKNRRIITYSLNKEADVTCKARVLENGMSRFTVDIHAGKPGGSTRIKDLKIKAVGAHNISNACAAVAVANQLGLSSDVIYRGFSEFAGVSRRFTNTGDYNGIRVFDDYGHHPSEIDTVLRVAGEVIASEVQNGRIIAIVQPHRYTRLACLFNEFCQIFKSADYVLITDIYAAGEEPLAGITKEVLADSIRAKGHLGVSVVDDMSSIPQMVSSIARPGDYVILFGAGDITKYANELPRQLAALSQREDYKNSRSMVQSSTTCFTDLDAQILCSKKQIEQIA